METIEILRNIWFVIIGILFLGYSVLDGFDLGIGSLLPFLGKKEEEKKVLFNSIWPFWDGNEVWLITGGAALFASFPDAYATVFSGFYLALMLVLFALIFRAVSIEFYFYDTKHKKFWQWSFIIGSFIPSILFGVALGNVIVGIPLNKNMDFTGNLFTLLRPFPLIVSLLGLNVILLQGSTYTMLKTSGDLQQRATNITKKLWLSFIFLFGISLILCFIYLPQAKARIWAWVFFGIVLLSWILMKVNIKKGKDFLVFIMSSISFAGLWGIVGSIHFPNLVKASNDNSLSITITNASSSELTLKVMLVIALVGMPLVIFYTYYVYKTFKGKIIDGL